ncbi:carbohydrate ABC transporter permease [Devosia nitrariae]|uniref:Glycerol-3-phosphate ABC transporter permease n=1 Tax=Devosia nitrariae TaxID=2071872 RepID=A0ABQ5WAI4_9HYPH|nr:sugar ABC transporter permease [Devosia nitrariae]GLQ56883.1 glycerol-3-phosphate ABC transporter permease [Devosia nitrariae]
MARQRAKVLPYLMAGPYILMFAIFAAYPVGRAIYMSLFDWGIFGPNAFVGVANYLSLFGDRRFWSSVGVTTAFAAIYVPMIVVASLLIAVLLHRRLPGITIFRTAFFIPIVINVAVAAIAFNWLLAPDVGFVDQVLRFFGLPGQRMLSQPGWALFAIAIVALWTQTGFMVVILLAGLENIPDDLYEAARLDGTRPFYDLIYITIPLLRPILLIVMVLSIVHAFQIFGEVFIITQGGPYGSTTVMTMLLYEEGFERFALGRAAAIGVVITIIIASLSFIQFRFFRRQV